MRQKLEVVNEECPTHLFSATRVATVYLHGNSISLVYGHVVTRVGRGGTERHVFAIADRNQADWMRRYSDVFEQAFSNSPWSIFWVKVPALLRLVRQGR
jgi:predicted DNA binding protein